MTAGSVTVSLCLLQWLSGAQGARSRARAQLASLRGRGRRADQLRGPRPQGLLPHHLHHDHEQSDSGHLLLRHRHHRVHQCRLLRPIIQLPPILLGPTTDRAGQKRVRNTRPEFPGLCSLFARGQADLESASMLIFLLCAIPMTYDYMRRVF